MTASDATLRSGLNTGHVEATDPYCLRPGEARALPARHPWRRFAVLGDSIAQGVSEPVPGCGPLPRPSSQRTAPHPTRPGNLVRVSAQTGRESVCAIPDHTRLGGHPPPRRRNTAEPRDPETGPPRRTPPPTSRGLETAGPDTGAPAGCLRTGPCAATRSRPLASRISPPRRGVSRSGSGSTTLDHRRLPVTTAPSGTCKPQTRPSLAGRNPACRPRSPRSPYRAGHRLP
jgi:hypothetical protein